MITSTWEKKLEHAFPQQVISTARINLQYLDFFALPTAQRILYVFMLTVQKNLKEKQRATATKGSLFSVTLLFWHFPRHPESSSYHIRVLTLKFFLQNKSIARNTPAIKLVHDDNFLKIFH